MSSEAACQGVRQTDWHVRKALSRLEVDRGPGGNMDDQATALATYSQNMVNATRQRIEVHLGVRKSLTGVTLTLTLNPNPNPNPNP